MDYQKLWWPEERGYPEVEGWPRPRQARLGGMERSPRIFTACGLSPSPIVAYHTACGRPLAEVLKGAADRLLYTKPGFRGVTRLQNLEADYPAMSLSSWRHDPPGEEPRWTDRGPLQDSEVPPKIQWR